MRNYFHGSMCTAHLALMLTISALLYAKLFLVSWSCLVADVLALAQPEPCSEGTLFILRLNRLCLQYLVFYDLFFYEFFHYHIVLPSFFGCISSIRIFFVVWISLGAPILLLSKSRDHRRKIRNIKHSTFQTWFMGTGICIDNYLRIQVVYNRVHMKRGLIPKELAESRDQSPAEWESILKNNNKKKNKKHAKTWKQI